MTTDKTKSNSDAEQKYLILTKRLSVKYAKKLGWAVFLLKLTKHKNLSIYIKPYYNNFEQGLFSFGIDFHYRLKNVDHLGFNLGLKLILFEIEIEFSDDRHVEDYRRV